MAEPLRCTLSFASMQELQASWADVSGNRCFVPWPDEVETGRPVVVRLMVEGLGNAELVGTVLGPDFDVSGNVGLSVELTPESVGAIQAIRAPATSGEGAAHQLFSTTRITRSALGLPGTPPAASPAPAASTTAPTAPDTEEPLLEPGTMLEERFQIEAHIASGGMGDVYRAVHVHLKRPVALKLLKRVFAQDQEMWSRFKREAELVSQLESPHIVRVFDFGKTQQGQPYLAMEYVEGQRLDELLGPGPLDPMRAMTLLRQIFLGLEEAHALGIVHRDLKPPNIIIGRKRDGSESAKILDFGIARLADRPSAKDNKLTQVGMVVGTPAYLAPEQALAAPMDERTDIYAMGCVAYELLIGEPPFVSDSLPQVISMHLTQAPVPLQVRRPELAGWPVLCDAVLRALSKEKERRFPTAREFRLALEQAQGLLPGAGAVPPPGVNPWGPPPPVGAMGPGGIPLGSQPGWPAPSPGAAAPGGMPLGSQPGWPAPPPGGMPLGSQPGWPAPPQTWPPQPVPQPQGWPGASPPGWPPSPQGQAAGWPPPAQPQAPAAWPPPPSAPPAPAAPSADGWSGASAPPPPPSAPTAVNPEAAKAADDFFATSSARAPRGTRTTGVSTGCRLVRELAALKLELPPALVDAHATARDALGSRDSRGALARVELLGVAHGHPLFATAITAVFESTRRWKGIVDEIDEDGVTILFMGEGPGALTRAARAGLDLRDAVAELAARTTPPVSLAARTALVAGALEPGPTAAVSGELPLRARSLLGRFPGGVVALERGTAQELADTAELAPLPQTDLFEVTGRRSHLKRVEPPRVGRDNVLVGLDRRLASLAQGVVAPIVVRGTRGSGRTLLAEEFMVRARQKGLVVGVARGAPSLRQLPFGGLVELLAQALGVLPQQVPVALRPALEALPLPPGALEATLALSGLAPLPQLYTAGQAVHAVRLALRALAGEKTVMLVFDGLEAFDTLTVEAFRELASRPAARELTVGFADAEVTDERLGLTPSVALPPFTSQELAKWAGTIFEGTPSPALLDLLMKLSNGWPGLLVDWAHVLDGLGVLREKGGQLQVGGEAPSLDNEALRTARFEGQPLDVQRLLEAALVSGDVFDAQALSVAWPRANPPAFQRTALSRLIRTVGNRRWTFSSPRIEAVVALAPSPDRPGMHQRLAAALLEQARANPQAADAARLAQHFTGGGDGARAAPLWRHAAEQALARRAFRDAIAALRGWSDALALLPTTPQLSAGRVDALARAAGLALVLQDAGQARPLVDEAQALAAKASLTSAELALSTARVLRSEARRAKANEALAQAEAAARGTPLEALVEAERGEAREQEGDLASAIVAFEKALVLAPQAADVARWHGEVDLAARLEARLGGVSLSRKEMLPARRLFESSLARWKAAKWPYAEARVLANLGTLLVMMKDPKGPPLFFEAAAQAAARCGDTLFEAKMRIQQAKALKLGDSPQLAKPVATAARALCLSIAWTEGAAQAEGLMA